MKKGYLALLGVALALVLGVALVALPNYSQVNRLKKENKKLKKEVASLKKKAETEEEGEEHEHKVPKEFVKKQNPIPDDSSSIAQGKVLYEASCWVCHGKEGKGNGPAAKLLEHKPTDFTTHLEFATVLEGSPGTLFYQIYEEGMPGEGMPSFKGYLSEEDVWNIINYLGTFIGKSSSQEAEEHRH